MIMLLKIKNIFSCLLSISVTLILTCAKKYKKKKTNFKIIYTLFN